jgi:hypothetical protein
VKYSIDSLPPGINTLIIHYIVVSIGRWFFHAAKLALQIERLGHPIPFNFTIRMWKGNIEVSDEDVECSTNSKVN